MYEEERDYREEVQKPTDSHYSSDSQSHESHQDNYSGQWHSQERQPEWETSYNRMNMSHIPPEPERTPGKKRPVMMKVAGITAKVCISHFP